MAEIPHFDVPFSFIGGLDGAGVPKTTEQGSIEEVVNCVQVICRYPQDFREEESDFGIPDPTFTQGDVNTEQIKSQINKWEPRAEANLEELYDSYDAGIRTILLEAGVRNG